MNTVVCSLSAYTYELRKYLMGSHHLHIRWPCPEITRIEYPLRHELCGTLCRPDKITCHWCLHQRFQVKSSCYSATYGTSHWKYRAKKPTEKIPQKKFALSGCIECYVWNNSSFNKSTLSTVKFRKPTWEDLSGEVNVKVADIHT